MATTSKFCYRAHILNSRTVSLSEISFTDYKNFIKILTNNDIDIINMFIDGLISKILISDDITIDDLSALDKLIILLNVRAFCIEPSVKFEFKNDDTKKKFSYTVNINELAEQISLFPVEDTFDISTENMVAKFNLPSQIIKSSIRPDQYINDSLSQLTILDKDIDISNSNILQKLPAQFSSQFVKSLVKIDDLNLDLSKNILGD